jgi:hypothetical protein
MNPGTGSEILLCLVAIQWNSFPSQSIEEYSG